MLIGPINFNDVKTILAAPQIEGVRSDTANRCDFVCTSTNRYVNYQLTVAPPPLYKS